MLLSENAKLSATTARLGTDPLPKLLLRLSLPSIVSMIVISLYNLVDAIWLGQLGYQAIAVVTVFMPFFIVCMAIGVGIGIGVNALSSRNFGAQDPEGANRATGQAFFLCMIMGFVLMLVANLFPREILLICGSTEDLLEMGEQYLRIFGFGLPFFLFVAVSRNIFMASGEAIKPMFFIIFAQVANIILDPLFIFGLGPFPEMGVAGAAMATALASGLGAMLALWYILSGRTPYRLRFHHLKPSAKTILAISRVGLPSMLMELTGGVGFAVFNHVAAVYGSVVLAATGIAGRIADLAFMPIFGMAHGVLPIIGFSLGARHWTRLWGTARLAILWLSILMFFSTLILEIFAPQIIRIFNTDPALLEVAIPGMRIFCSTLILYGPLVIFITTFQGLSKGTLAMFVSLCHQFLFFIPGLLLFPLLWNLTGVWIAMPVSDFLGASLASWLMYREYRRQKNRDYWKGYVPSAKAD
ncbi:MAG TPA: MATE family efflux transporter [Dehalococcoidales bacterium]|nr:MATE family efflux transporter [Dehalococcoidales bacterium]